MTAGDFIESTASAVIGTYIPTFHHVIVHWLQHAGHWLFGVCCGWAITLIRSVRFGFIVNLIKHLRG
jgi:hypothetical protein